MKPKPIFSLLHASYGRPDKAIAAMNMAIDRAQSSENIEYLFAVNSDDPTHERLNGKGSMTMASNFSGSAQAWDAAAGISEGEILIQMQDDLELPAGWDVILLKSIIDSAGMDWAFKPLVVAVGDGYRKDGLLCTAICNRARYKQKGEFLHHGYISVFSDDDFTYRALRDERDGLCEIVRTGLTFLHRHHYHDPSVPMDDTYRRENSAEAYRLGGALFAQRNPKAATDGLKTW